MASLKQLPNALVGYVAGLSLLLLALLAWSATLHGGLFSARVSEWLLLTAIFALAEYATSLLFHHAGGRQGLSVSEAILLPMLVGLSLSQVVWGVSLAIIIAGIAQRVDRFKGTFNVASLGIAAAVAAWIWREHQTPSTALTPKNALVAIVAIMAFALLTHVFTVVAISLAERRRVVDLTREIAGALTWNLVGNISLGILFAASFAAAPWTVVLFLLPLGALFLGYRAVLRQQQERERVEGLHTASRALAVSADLDHALQGFLMAVSEVVSAKSALVAVKAGRDTVSFSVDEGVAGDAGEPVLEGPIADLLGELTERKDSLLVSGLEGGPDARFARALGRQDVLATPLLDGESVIGMVAALDRVGAEEFGVSDMRLLQALGHELVLTLDSYRLFAQVAEERERFQQIFAGSKEGICLLDEDGVIRAWNPALARITGFAEEDIIGEQWSERVLVRDRYHRRIEGIEIIAVPPDEELELVTRQGPPRWVSIMSGEVQSEDTKSWVILVRDITAEHELEESKSDFLSTISHELRTPLTTIKGSLQVLSRPNASVNTEIGTQMIEIMKRGSDRLERLVMNLLAVSQMESGDVQVYPDQVALEDMVRSRVASILVDHPEVDIRADDNIVVRADRERLAQAIEHLLDNARKFGPESGPIQIEITRENGFARLSVRDEGPGIPKIDQDRIFDRFVRLGHVLTRETQGPGVGLFIVKRSVEAMGGSIAVESEPGNGATFHLRIPLARPMAAVEPASTA